MLRYVYRNQLFVKHMGANKISGFQQITPETFRVFPHLVDRLIPWIRRDLCAILSVSYPQEGDSQYGQRLHPEQDNRLYKYEEIGTGVELIREFIIAVLKKYDLQTDQGQDLLYDFLQERTEHFVHELMAFARSSLSIAAYDKMAQYNISPSAPADVANGWSRPNPSATVEPYSVQRVQQRHDRRSTDCSVMHLGDLIMDDTLNPSYADTVPTIDKRFSNEGADIRATRRSTHHVMVGGQGKPAESRASSSTGKIRSNKRYTIDSRARLPVSSAHTSDVRASGEQPGTIVQEAQLTLERPYSTHNTGDMLAILQARLKRERELYDNSRRRG